MKKRLFLIVLLLPVQICLAQKADIEKIQISYVQLPIQPLEKNIGSYKLDVVNNSGLELPTKDELTNKIKLEGFQYSESQPDVIISIEFNSYQENYFAKTVPGSMNAPETYVNAVDAIIDGNMSIISADKLYEYYPTNNFGKADALTYSKEAVGKYASKADAEAKMKDDKFFFRTIKSECINNAIKTINNYLNDHHGYAKKTEELPICSIKAKKYDYSAMDQAMEKYTTAMKDYSSNGLNETNKAQLKECVGIWENAVSEYDPNDKKAKFSEKNIAEIYLNLVMANLWLNDYGKAKKYNELLQNEKGLLAWKPKINGMVTQFEAGYQLNEQRENGTLKVVKKASEFFVSPFLVVKDNDYRIKYIEYYNEYEPKKLDHRKVFEYNKNGMVIKTYIQKYDPGSITFSGEFESEYIEYDQAANKMIILKENRSKEEIKIAGENGIVYQLIPISPKFPNEYDINYDTQGRYLGYKRKPQKGGSAEEYSIIYKDGKADHTIYSSRFINFRDTTYRNTKYQLYWNNDELTRFEVSHDRAKVPSFDNIAYSGELTYDEQGNITKINEGMQTFHYKSDNNGNIIELIISSDTTPTHYTYKWEQGSGNASLYFFDIMKRNRHYFVHPDLY